MVFEESMLELDESNYSDFLDNDICVLHFFSDNQMNCLMTMPMIEDVAQEFKEKGEIYFGKINVDDFEEIAREHKVFGVPTIIFLRGGQQIDRIEITIHEELLREKLSSLLSVCVG
jgi:thioredoxin 1